MSTTRTFSTLISLVHVLVIYAIAGASALSAQQTINETLMHDGVLRQYTLYIPAVYDDQVPAPLVLNYHGFGGTAASQMAYGDMRAEADAAGFILVYPQGTLLNGATHWNVGSWTAGSTADDLGFTEAMLDAIVSTYTIDQNRVYSSGYSNGGYFSFVLACHLSDRIAAIGSVAGSMSSETFKACVPSRPLSVLQIHGTADNAVFYDGGTPIGSKSIDDVLAYWTSLNHTVPTPLVTDLMDLNPNDGSTVQHYLYEGGDLGTSVVHYKVLGGGHDWPDVNGDPTQVNVDFSAGTAIWDFVSQYDVNGIIDTSVEVGGRIDAPAQILAYPNPTSNTLTVVVDTERGGSSYQLRSVLGQLILEGRISSGRTQIDLSALSPGMYLLQVENRLVKIIKV